LTSQKCRFQIDLVLSPEVFDGREVLFPSELVDDVNYYDTIRYEMLFALKS